MLLAAGALFVVAVAVPTAGAFAFTRLLAVRLAAESGLRNFLLIRFTNSVDVRHFDRCQSDSVKVKLIGQRSENPAVLIQIAVTAGPLKCGLRDLEALTSQII